MQKLWLTAGKKCGALSDHLGLPTANKCVRYRVWSAASFTLLEGGRNMHSPDPTHEDKLAAPLKALATTAQSLLCWPTRSCRVAQLPDRCNLSFADYESNVDVRDANFVGPMGHFVTRRIWNKKFSELLNLAQIQRLAEFLCLGGY